MKYTHLKNIMGVLLLMLSLTAVNPTFADNNVVRVGLTDNKSQNVLKQTISVYGTSDCDICDRETHKIIYSVPAETDITIKNGVAGLDISINGHGATLRNFVIVCPRGLLGVKDLTRKGKPALYHGAFEVVQHQDRKGFY